MKKHYQIEYAKHPDIKCVEVYESRKSDKITAYLPLDEMNKKAYRHYYNGNARKYYFSRGGFVRYEDVEGRTHKALKSTYL